MTTETITLSSFLLDRIDDDEAMARTVRPDEYLNTRDDSELGSADAGGYETCRITSGRVLAECAAKRAIVDLHAAYPTPQVMVYGTITACSECGSVDDSPVEWPCPTLRNLAAVYADSPEFREEWRP